jgi:hypothetical protein
MAINGWTAQSVTFLKADHPKKGNLWNLSDQSKVSLSCEHQIK